MPSLGGPEMIFILVIVLFIFGAGRLPEVGRSMGKAITEFKQGIAGGGDDKPQQTATAAALPAADRNETGQKNA
ncbi:MAG: twin-arginine translocase TatA/TatE family subunit [Chloroflexi bacterium]|nr:twin-arginine translocase TatA/TatE family subunit [Chloroflexota bacterium]